MSPNGRPQPSSSWSGWDQFVHDNMGYHFDQFIPLVGAIFALSIGCNLISVVGLWSPTADLNTEAAWAIVVFCSDHVLQDKDERHPCLSEGPAGPDLHHGTHQCAVGDLDPVSMAFRHFGNILSGTVISTLLYWALASLSHVIFGWLPLPEPDPAVPDRHPGLYGPVFRLVRRLYSGVHLLHAHHNLHQTCCR